jgi:uncharacterized protein (DUF1697 family)
MQKYIALLRGVNVGGSNKISMPQLKAAFEENGFTEVMTYINSGNVIFLSGMDSIAEIQRKCVQAIADTFKQYIPVAVLSAKELSTAMNNAPDWWGMALDTKHNAIFVIPPATPETIMAEVGAPKPEYEQVAYYGQVIFWSAPLKTFSRTRWSKIIGTAAYDSVTIRNANTARKLLQLVEQ